MMAVQDLNTPEMIAKSEIVIGRLKLISNANRLRILCRLLSGEMSVGDIETELEIRQPTLSREIGRLRDAGAISARRQSKVVFYTLSDPDMKDLIEAVCAASSNQSIASPALKGTNQNTEPPSLSFNARPKFSQAKIRTCPTSAPMAQI